MTADTGPAAEIQPGAKVFISYSRKDMAFADRLETALKARGFEPLIDRTEIYAFEDWWKRIEELIGRADTVVFVVSPDAVASDVALKEVAHAASLNKRFAPIVCRRTDDVAVPEALRRLNFILFDDPAGFEASVDQLAEALNTDIGWVRQHTEYGEAARRWAAAGRSGGLLLRSPVLEEAERWIASRPRGAPEPTEETQAFVADSRRGATRRRNILTGSLGAGLIVALVLAGLAFWQRQVAVEQRQIADQQRKRAEDTLAAATTTANSLLFDLAQRFRHSTGVPSDLIMGILKRARGLQQQLIQSGQITPELKRSEEVALDETATSLMAVGDTNGALAAAEQAKQIERELLAADPSNTLWRHDVSISEFNISEIKERQGDLVGALEAARNSLKVKRRLSEVDLNNADWQRDLAAAYGMIGWLLHRQGQLKEALNSLHEANDILRRLVKVNPDNEDWQRNLWLSTRRIGQVQQLQGDIASALQSYKDALAIVQQLTQSDGTNAQWQSDLSISHQDVGDMLEEQHDLAGALASYRASLSIMDRLAQSDTHDGDWQHILTLLYGRIGKVQKSQGDLADALTSFQREQEIISRLAKTDPNNGDWQRELEVSFNYIGDVQVAQKDLPGALNTYQQALPLAERLAKAHSSEANWQRDLSLAYENIGNVQLAQQDPAGALQWYEKSLAITEMLAKSDLANGIWQRDLAVSYTDVGNAQLVLDNLDGALTSYLEALDVIEQLARSNPGNSRWQRDVQIGYDKLFKLFVAEMKKGNAQWKANDFAGALNSYRAGLTGMDRVAQSDPNNDAWQEDNALCYAKLADVYGRLDQSNDQVTALRSGQAIMRKLLQSSPDNADWQQKLAWFSDKIMALAK